MDRSKPQLQDQDQDQHRRRRGGINHTPSSFARSSHVIQSNSPTNNVKSSKPNRSNASTSNRDDGVEDETLPNIIGTCSFMCPVEEKERRERLRDLAVFERLHGNPGKTSSSLAVKKFCRTISTKHIQPSDVRPLPVLEDTLNYLLDLLDSCEHSFEVLHEFIFDRMRSIRQDLSMQNIISIQAVHMYERLVKFHVISLHKLQRCTGSPNLSPMHHLNMEQLMKTLASLYNLYEANWKSPPFFENEAEFRSFYVLLHLGSNSQPMGESLSLWFRHVPSPILKSKEMLFSRRVLRYFCLGNYKRFICTIEAEASYLQYCIIERYISEVRALALSCVNYGGYKLHPYPLPDLSKLLHMKETDVVSFCTDCGLKTTTDEDGRKFLPTKQTNFYHPKRSSQNHYLLDSERLMREFSQCSVVKLLQT